VAEEYKVGVFALLCTVAVGAVIGLLRGPIWYAVGPAIVYVAYFVKVRVRGLRDKPSVVMFVLATVSVAMIGFAVL
jgi:hypothetical protein